MRENTLRRSSPLLPTLPTLRSKTVHGDKAPTSRINNRPQKGRQTITVDLTVNEKGPSSFEPSPSSHVAAKLLLDLRLPRPCGRSITFTETLAASAIPPLDKTRS